MPVRYYRRQESHRVSLCPSAVPSPSCWLCVHVTSLHRLDLLIPSNINYLQTKPRLKPDRDPVICCLPHGFSATRVRPSAFNLRMTIRPSHPILLTDALCTVYHWPNRSIDAAVRMDVVSACRAKGGPTL